MNVNEVRQLLPIESHKSFDDILFSRVLGANKHIDMIGQMMKSIIDSESDLKQMMDRVLQLSEYYKQTRGNQSRAVYNAINEMVFGFQQQYQSTFEDAKKYCIERIDDYQKRAQKNTQHVIDVALNMSENYKSVMVYDYSSTLNEFLKQSKESLDIYIAESRALDGGKPFVSASLASGHKTHFFPDALMLTVLEKVDAVFIGVESFYPDGTVFNTVGSDILAILCKHLNKPLYALTPLIKVDTRNTQGIKRLSPMPYDFGIKIATAWDDDLKKQVDFTGVKLVEIAPEYISAIVTEKGVIPPTAMFAIAMEYASSLEGEE